jgi:hypothetical protein
MNIRFLIGSSFFDRGKFGTPYRREFARQWSASIKRLSPAPSRVVIIAEGASKRPDCGDGFDVLTLTGDLGHCGQHLNGSKLHEFTGWSASMLAGAMLAYTDESDFVYVEEDCLIFGPAVRAMYADLGDGCLIFGRKHQSHPWMSCSQSLFLVKHAFIPTFVSTYLRMGKDGKLGNLGEEKFVKMQEQFGPSIVRQFTFGYDRERPVNYDDPVFYMQQISPEELTELQNRKLIP